jgi:predicted alpha/beta-hydrolase family hydrolase
VHKVRIPKFFIQSTHDEFGPRDQFARFFESLPEPKHLDWVEASDHFFNNNLGGLESVVERIGFER